MAPPFFRPAVGPGSEADRVERQREFEARRRAQKPWRSWYKLPAWYAARQRQLSKQPLCERCERRGVVEPATVVNHRRPHRGVWDLFIDSLNHESVCKPCHDGEIQAEEKALQR